jgi:hypothetical protein
VNLKIFRLCPPMLKLRKKIKYKRNASASRTVEEIMLLKGKKKLAYEARWTGLRPRVYSHGACTCP